MASKECALCLENFKDPRILTCFHTFCRDCLEAYIPKASGTQFGCPLCRAKTVIPKKGVDGLQKNFYLEESVEKDEKFNHPLCALHAKEDLRFYCRDCKKTICRDCKVVSHGNHTTAMVNDVFKEMSEKLEEVLNDCETSLYESETQMRAGMENEVSILKTTLLVITKSAEQLKQNIDSVTGQLTNLIKPSIDEVRRNFSRVIHQLGGKQAEICDDKRRLSSAVSENDHASVFNLFNKLIDNQEQVRGWKEPLSGPDSNDKAKFDGKRLKSVFFEFRDTIERAFKEFQENKMIKDHRDLNMEDTNTARVSEPDGQVPTVGVTEEDKVKQNYLKTNADSTKKNRQTHKFCGKVQYYSSRDTAYRCLKWRAASIVFSRKKTEWKLSVHHVIPPPGNAVLTFVLTPASLISYDVSSIAFIETLHPSSPKDSTVELYFKPDEIASLNDIKNLLTEIKPSIKTFQVPEPFTNQSAFKSTSPMKSDTIKSLESKSRVNIAFDSSTTAALVTEGTQTVLYNNLNSTLFTEQPSQLSGKRKALDTPNISAGKRLRLSTGNPSHCNSTATYSTTGASPGVGYRLCLLKYPPLWRGSLRMKREDCTVKLLFTAGALHVARLSRLDQSQDDTMESLQVKQRMTLNDKQTLASLTKCMQKAENSCTLVAIPSGRDNADQSTQTRAMSTGFIDYLLQKEAAGIVFVGNSVSQKPEYGVHIFPPCEFSRDTLLKVGKDLYQHVKDKPHLTVIIAKIDSFNYLH